MATKASGEATGGEGYITDGFPAPGLKKMTRFMTSHNSEGKGIFISRDSGDHHRVMGEQQAVANILYSTKETPVDLTDEKDVKAAAAKEPPLHCKNGTLIRMIDFAPGLKAPMHRALSIDYGIVMEGSFELGLDSGETRILHQGDVCIQRATMHTWKNITENCTKPGRMLFILLDVKPFEVNGIKVEEDMGALGKEYVDREE